MAKERLTQETDEIKSLVGIVVERVCRGEAPAELVALYKTMKPKQFAYWLHGFFCGYLHRKEKYQMDIFKFLEKVSKEN